MCRAANAGPLALVGAVNIPIIYFSVKLVEHAAPGATISMTAAPKHGHTMLTGDALMTFAFWAYSFAVVFTRRRAILEQEAETDWVREMLPAEMTMNWKSFGRVLAHGGYGLYVWGSYAVVLLVMVIEPLHGPAPLARSAAMQAGELESRNDMKSRGAQRRRSSWSACWRPSGGRGLVLNAFQQPGVLLQPVADRLEERGAARRTFRVGGLVEEAVVREGVTVKLRRHRHRAERAGARRHPARPVQGRQGRGRPGSARADGHLRRREVLAKHDDELHAARGRRSAEQSRPDEGSEDRGAERRWGESHDPRTGAVLR